ncbi:hypothetical protein RIF29_09961 [Crotalaria pallida]|uniref:CCHC-type domain-containing protein n=1 Tax=Crotalaria pallida TaxID=3830 RepID=A0AAN9II54_CROPI
MEGVKDVDYRDDEIRVVQLPEIDFDGDENADNDLWLVGRVLTQNPYNVRAFKSTMVQVWKAKKGVEVRDVSKNLFSFRFFCRKDMDAVLRMGPWNFDKNLVLLKELKDDESPADVKLTTTMIWIRAYELPLNMRSELVSRTIGNSVDSFLQWDSADDQRLGKFLRIRIEMDITKPLKRLIMLQRKGKTALRIPLRYERLGNFCYFCGMMDHVLRDCDEKGDEVDEFDINSLPYGSELRASPRRNNVISGSKGEGVLFASRKSLFKEEMGESSGNKEFGSYREDEAAADKGLDKVEEVLSSTSKIKGNEDKVQDITDSLSKCALSIDKGHAKEVATNNEADSTLARGDKNVAASNSEETSQKAESDINNGLMNKGTASTEVGNSGSDSKNGKAHAKVPNETRSTIRKWKRHAREKKETIALSKSCHIKRKPDSMVFEMDVDVGGTGGGPKRINLSSSAEAAQQSRREP